MTSHTARTPEPLPASPAAQSSDRDRLLLALGTLAVWGHTADEIRIGEYIAVPAAIATAALLVAWPRTRRSWRAGAAVLLGLVWLLGAVPYHVVPLLQGAVVWQNVSGLLQLAGGAALLLLGLRTVRPVAASADAREG